MVVSSIDHRISYSTMFITRKAPAFKNVEQSLAIFSIIFFVCFI